jgi:hypothetical protein
MRVGPLVVSSEGMGTEILEPVIQIDLRCWRDSSNGWKLV